MHHFEQLARRVASKSVECCDFCWISGPQVKMALQRNWNNRKQLETVGNSWKQSEIVGNSWERPGMIMPILSPRIFLRQNSFHAIPLIVWRSSGKRLEAVGALCVWVGRKRIIDFTKNDFVFFGAVFCLLEPFHAHKAFYTNKQVLGIGMRHVIPPWFGPVFLVKFHMFCSHWSFTRPANLYFWFELAVFIPILNGKLAANSFITRHFCIKLKTFMDDIHIYTIYSIL